MTRSPETQQSASSSSSAMPSQKNPWSPAGERSANGRTATAGSWAGAAPGEAAAAPSGAVRSRPPGVRSKAQASATATGRPSARAATTAVRTQSPSRSACMIGSTTCSTAKAATP